MDSSPISRNCSLRTSRRPTHCLLQSLLPQFLRDHGHHFLQPLFDDPEYDPNLDYDPPMRHNTPPPVEVGGADEHPTIHVCTEIEVIDPLDPSLAPIILGPPRILSQLMMITTLSLISFHLRKNQSKMMPPLTLLINKIIYSLNKTLSHHKLNTILVLFLRLSLPTFQVKDLEMTPLLDVVGLPRYPA